MSYMKIRTLKLVGVKLKDRFIDATGNDVTEKVAALAGEVDRQVRAENEMYDKRYNRILGVMKMLSPTAPDEMLEEELTGIIRKGADVYTL